LHQPLAEGKGVVVRQGLEEAGSKTAAWGTRSVYEAVQVGRVGNHQQSPMQSRAWEVDATSAQGKPTFLPGETCHQAMRQHCLWKQS